MTKQADILQAVDSPADLRRLPAGQLKQLCAELRAYIWILAVFEISNFNIINLFRKEYKAKK
jgi:hypothetical protein